jgi:molybdopterin-binding protein
VTIDCGVVLISEITARALFNLDVKIGSELYCLFKAKAVEIIHIYEKT